jgi:hypothetical protein
VESEVDKDGGKTITFVFQKRLNAAPGGFANV